MSNNGSDPNKQFLAFDALKFIRKTNVTSEECAKKELCDDDCEKINNILQTLKKMDVVKVNYYDTNKYVTISGTITELNYTLKFIKIIKKIIYFNDILEISKK